MLINEENTNIVVREDLMSNEFPSIWCEERRDNEKNVIIGGFYREWSTEGIRSAEAQRRSINLFTNQIENAAKDNKNVIILGDANMCSLQWEYPEFSLSEIAGELLGTLAQCGLSNIDLGVTYQADRLTDQGEIIKSALDHVYVSDQIKKSTKVKKLKKQQYRPCPNHS